MIKVFLDMDGVLCNIIDGIKTVMGLPDKWVPKEYYFITAEHWVKINATPDFWENLTPYKEGVDLYHWILENITQELYILTAPNLDTGCASQKTRWLRKNLRGFFPSNRLIITPYKSLLAKNPGCFLIDDCNDNCTKWDAAGGQSLLYNAPYNNTNTSLSAEGIKQRLKHFIKNG